MSGSSAKVAVLAVRHGRLPNGATAVAADASHVVVVGTGVKEAAIDLPGAARAHGFETGTVHVDAWAPALREFFTGSAAETAVTVVMLPAGPDGAVLGPALAQCLGWPFVAGALEVAPGRATRVLPDGLTVEELSVDGPFVATVLNRPEHPAPSSGGATLKRNPAKRLELFSHETITFDPSAVLGSVESMGELPAAVATMDLADADRIIAAGAGLGESERLTLLAAVGERIGAAMGATRVLADRGWVSHRRQIGTTGVAVNPRLYLAFGISGASQHTSGLGQPDHVVSVNVDASCPMMAMADLAVVADAPEVLTELARLLGVEP